MATDVLLSLKATFDHMKSSITFDISERKNFAMIADTLEKITCHEVDHFIELRDVQWTDYGNVGGILRLVDDQSILSAWRRIWIILSNSMPDLEESSKLPTLRSYLWTCSYISGIIGSNYLLPSKVAPKLSMIPEWKAPIDDVLSQRYEKQVSKIVINAKRLLDDCVHPLKLDAQELIAEISPNVDNGSTFTHYVRSEMYKLQHGVDLKSSFYFDVHFGDRAPIVLKRSLLSDFDLKEEMETILRKLSTTQKPDEVYTFVVRLLIVGGFKSVLNFCLKRAKLDPSQLNPTPLRSKLKIIQSSNK